MIHTREKREKRWAVIAVLILLSIILWGIALTMPWWHYTVDFDPPGNLEISSGVEFKLDEVTFVGSEMENVEETMFYDDLRDEPFWDDEIRVYDTTFFLTIGTIIFAIISLIAAVVIFARRSAGKGGTVLLIITLLIAITIPIFMGFTLPNAIGKDYYDSYDESNFMDLSDEEIEALKPAFAETFAGIEEDDENYMSITWGPAIGWYLALAAFILIGTAAVLTIFPPRDRRIEADAPKPSTMYMEEPMEVEEVKTQSEPAISEITIECPGCTGIFKVKTATRPVTVNCPFCGAEGEIK